MRYHQSTSLVTLLLHFTRYYICWSGGIFWTSALTLPRQRRLPVGCFSIASSLGMLEKSTSHRTSDHQSRPSSIRSIPCHGNALQATPKFRLNENEEGEEEDDAENLRRSAKSSSFSSSVNENLALDPLVLDTSLSFRRISWLSWWSQVILTTVSSVTLLFARNVVVARRAVAAVSGASVFWLAGWGIVASLTSIVWTWGGTRLSRRLLRKATTRVSAANMSRRAIRIGILINLIGMGLTLLGAEQIVGGLAIKVLTQQQTAISPFSPQLGALVQTVEPLDILVVQANTNTLFSHFCSLTSLLYLTRWTSLLDPPSVERKERPRQ